MNDISALLESIKAEPYIERLITAPHCGVATFSSLLPGDKVVGPHGEFKEKAGTRLAILEREHNPKSIDAPEQGELVSLNTRMAGKFVEAGTELARIRHFLTRDEVLAILLKKALHLFCAPERAKYYFAPAVDVKIKVSGPKSVAVHSGMELFIMSRMKREAPLAYTGPDGVIYAVYFDHTKNIDAGEALIGVCPPDLVNQIEDVVMRVQTEWREGE